MNAVIHSNFDFLGQAIIDFDYPNTFSNSDLKETFLSLPANEQVSGIKDKSKIFSSFYENNYKSPSNDNLKNDNQIFDNSINNTSSLFDSDISESSSDVNMLSDSSQKEFIESVVDYANTPLENGILLLKESIANIAKSTLDYTSESLNNYHFELVELYNGLVKHCAKKDFLNKTHEKLNIETPIHDTKPVVENIQVINPNVNSITNESNIALLNKLTSSVSRLSDNLHEIENLKEKINRLYKNESFSYSTSFEIKNKIKNYSKKLYEVFKFIQKDLNTPVKNEFWEVIQFGKDTSNYKNFIEKVNSLSINYNNYYNNINNKYNDYLTTHNITNG